MIYALESDESECCSGSSNSRSRRPFLLFFVIVIIITIYFFIFFFSTRRDLYAPRRQKSLTNAARHNISLSRYIVENSGALLSGIRVLFSFIIIIIIIIFFFRFRGRATTSARNSWTGDAILNDNDEKKRNWAKCPCSLRSTVVVGSAIISQSKPFRTCRG